MFINQDNTNIMKCFDTFAPRHFHYKIPSYEWLICGDIPRMVVFRILIVIQLHVNYGFHTMQQQCVSWNKQIDVNKFTVWHCHNGKYKYDAMWMNTIMQTYKVKMDFYRTCFLSKSKFNWLPSNFKCIWLCKLKFNFSSCFGIH